MQGKSLFAARVEIVTALVGGALTLPTMYVRADAATDARKSIEAAYKAEDAATAKKDRDAFFRAYASTYVIIDKSGKKHSLEESKQQVKGLFDAYQTIKVTQKVKTFALQTSRKANVTMTAHMESTESAMQGSETKSKQIIDDVSVEDEWIKTGNTWLKQRTKMLTGKMTVHGK